MAIDQRVRKSSKDEPPHLSPHLGRSLGKLIKEGNGPLDLMEKLVAEAQSRLVVILDRPTSSRAARGLKMALFIDERSGAWR
jgi:hypothetical protein